MDSNYWLILAVFSLVAVAISTLFKYSLVTSSILINSKDIDEGNFFHSKLQDYKEDFKKFNSGHYVISTIYTILYVVSSYNTIIHHITNTNLNILYTLCAITFTYFVIHFIFYALAITAPIVFFSIMFYPYRFFMGLFIPVVILFKFVEKMMFKNIKSSHKYSFLSSEDRELLLTSFDDSGVVGKNDDLDQNDVEMINSIFEFKETTVKEIMVPRINVTGIGMDLNFSEVISVFKKMNHSRIPVYSENIDHVKGVLYVKDLIKKYEHHDDSEYSWLKLLREPYFIPMSKKIDDLLTEFKTKKLHMAIVVDEFGGTAGIITMEDILEEIVGEIEDEYDTIDKDIREINENLYIIKGHTSIDDIEEETPIRFKVPEDAPFDSISGFIQDYAEDIPKEGFIFEKHGLMFKVLRVDGPKIVNVRVERLDTDI